MRSVLVADVLQGLETRTVPQRSIANPAVTRCGSLTRQLSFGNCSDFARWNDSDGCDGAGFPMTETHIMECLAQFRSSRSPAEQIPCREARVLRHLEAAGRSHE